MPFTDHIAAQRLVDLREARGLSQEGLAAAIKRHSLANGWMAPDGLGRVDADTIRRIERDSHCPSERVRLVIALYFGVQIREIWDPGHRRSKSRVAA